MIFFRTKNLRVSRTEFESKRIHKTIRLQQTCVFSEKVATNLIFSRLICNIPKDNKERLKWHFIKNFWSKTGNSLLTKI